MKLLDLQKCFDNNFCPFCNNLIKYKNCEECSLILDKHNSNYMCRIENQLIRLRVIYYGNANYHKSFTNRLYITISSLGHIELYNNWVDDSLLKISEDTTFDDIKELLNKIYKIEVFK